MSQPPAISSEAPERRIDWRRWQAWYMRLAALLLIGTGVFAWAIILGLDPSQTRAFEARATTFQAITIGFAVLDLVAGVGLWLVAPWGGVVFLAAVFSRVAASFAFPAAAALSWSWIAGYVALALAFIVLAWLAGRQSG